MAVSRQVRTLILVLMDILIIVAVAVVLRLVVVFFGVLASADWGKGVLAMTRLVVIPFGIKGIQTPYDGTFDVNGVLTVLVLLGAEWALGTARRAS